MEVTVHQLGRFKQPTTGVGIATCNYANGNLTSPILRQHYYKLLIYFTPFFTLLFLVALRVVLSGMSVMCMGLFVCV